MNSNKRRSTRLPIQLEVEFTHDEMGLVHLVTKNISDTGVFITVAEDKQPPIGTTAMVKLKKDFEDGEEAPTLHMRIVRKEKQGIGLEFIL